MIHAFTDPDLIELDRIWPLGQKLVVPDGGTIVVAGAYRGLYLHYFSELFPTAKLYGFEPQSKAFLDATDRLGDKAKLFPYGLATANRTVMMGNYSTDGCSAVCNKGAYSAAHMADAVEALFQIRNIDLFVVNVEGGEWALIPYLLDEMMHHKISSMAIQFHPEYVSVERSQRVLGYLREYYNNTFNCPGWTYWEQK